MPIQFPKLAIIFRQKYQTARKLIPKLLHLPTSHPKPITPKLKRPHTHKLYEGLYYWFSFKKTYNYKFRAISRHLHNEKRLSQQ